MRGTSTSAISRTNYTGCGVGAASRGCCSFEKQGGHLPSWCSQPQATWPRKDHEAGPHSSPILQGSNQSFLCSTPRCCWWRRWDSRCLPSQPAAPCSFGQLPEATDGTPERAELSSHIGMHNVQIQTGAKEKLCLLWTDSSHKRMLSTAWGRLSLSKVMFVRINAVFFGQFWKEHPYTYNTHQRQHTTAKFPYY